MFQSLRVRVLFGVLLWLMVISTCVTFGQIGNQTELWTWTKSAPHHSAVVQVDAGGSTGTGVIFYIDKTKRSQDGHEGYCLTAWHVVSSNQTNLKVRFSNGRKSKGCKVVDKDIEADVAVIWVWVPDEIQPVELARMPIGFGDKIEFAGLGGGTDVSERIRHFSGQAASSTSFEKIFADVPLLPGDSGGPVFNSKQEVVGIISGGWFWYDGGVKLPDGREIKATWPARTANVGPIRRLARRVVVK